MKWKGNFASVSIIVVPRGFQDLLVSEVRSLLSACAGLNVCVDNVLYLGNETTIVLVYLQLEHEEHFYVMLSQIRLLHFLWQG